MFIKRLLVAVLVVWFTTLLLMAVVESAVNTNRQDRDTMNVVGIVVVAIALVAGLVRFVTYRERELTAKDLEDGITVRRSVLLLPFMVVFGAVSFGVIALIFWMLTWGWPRRMDSEGILTRNGRRIRWKNVDQVTVGRTAILGIPINRWWEIGAREWQGLETVEVKTRIVPGFLWDGYAAVEYIEKSLGRSIR